MAKPPPMRPRRRPRPRTGAWFSLVAGVGRRRGAPGVRRTEDERGLGRCRACTSARFRLATSAGALERSGLSGERLGRGFLAGDQGERHPGRQSQSTKGARRIGRSFVPAHRARCKVFLGRDISRRRNAGSLRRNKLGKRPSCARPPRIAITGMGIVSPLGLDVGHLWSALLEGKSGVSFITEFPTDKLRSDVAASVTGFEPAQWLDQEGARHLRPGRAVRGRRCGRSDRPGGARRCRSQRG